MRLFPKDPPPGPAEEDFWLSPLRGPWLTAALGSLLLVLMTLVGLTGFLSHAAYDPDLGRNAIVPRSDDFQWLVFDWPTKPTWLYAANQGIHTIGGIVAVPLLLAKLWSVIPKLFAWPPLRSPAQALERVSLLALVGGAFFQLATGIANIQLWYPWHFNFVVAHYYGAWVFLSALFLHVAVKSPVIVSAYRTRGVLRPLLDGHDELEVHHPGSLTPPDPEPPSLSRRGLFALVGAAMGGLFVVQAGQSIGGPLRPLALLAPRGTGTGGFPVNKTASVARVTPAMVSAAWRLELRGPQGVVARLSRAQLLAMPQHTHALPIACVEGWSTTQHWTGVRLADLARAAGLDDAHELHVESLQPAGAFRQTTLSRDQVHAEQSLLALRVNGRDLPLDHGYPARIIVPALPGVHNTKWVKELAFS